MLNLLLAAIFVGTVRQVPVGWRVPGGGGCGLSDDDDDGCSVRVTCSRRLTVDSRVDVDRVTDLRQHGRHRTNSVLGRHHRRHDTDVTVTSHVTVTSP